MNQGIVWLNGLINIYDSTILSRNDASFAYSCLLSTG